MNKKKSIEINGAPLPLSDIITIAKGDATVTISKEKTFTDKILKSENLLEDALKTGVPVYGVTTGYGKSCGKRVAREIALKNGENLLRFHGCGTGEPLGIEETRAAMVSRLLCFSRGFSGVSIDLLEQIAAFLNNGITPIVPSEGSVGASGDLTPMSYVASALAGNRDVFYKGTAIPAKDAIEKAGLNPYIFKPKEPLAIINGTATMTGIAVIAIEKARRIMNASILATGLTIHALQGNAHHYHKLIGEAKPYPGQKYIADKIRNLLDSSINDSELASKTLESLQDPYSIRCSPQILGVLFDGLTWIEEWIEIESNSANDNPIFDPETGDPLMGGNFYGGHVVFAMDSLKAAIASLADMADRQIELLVDPHVNRGLPADLVQTEENKRLYNHGFKAMSITASALTAEALKLTMPAASFSRSTESHNQDKVSMGTIGARDANRICTLASNVTAIHLLAATQACEIRGHYEKRPELKKIIEEIRKTAEPVFEDRPMELDIINIAQTILTTDFYTN